MEKMKKKRIELLMFPSSWIVPYDIRRGRGRAGDERRGDGVAGKNRERATRLLLLLLMPSWHMLTAEK